jgi:hypothetical protein
MGHGFLGCGRVVARNDAQSSIKFGLRTQAGFGKAPRFFRGQLLRGEWYANFAAI